MVDEIDKNEDIKEEKADENTESGKDLNASLKDDNHEKLGDIYGTVSDGSKPPKKVTLFFSRKIWIAILTFLALTIIGAVIEFTVQTPISKYIEKVTGPRVRTLKDQLKIGNNEFVYKAVKEKFHDEPYDEDYLFLYTESTKGFINDLVKEREWEKARTFLNESLEGMPVPPEHRTALRRTFAKSLPIFFKENHTEYGKKEKKEWIDGFADYAKSLALKEKEDADLQYYVGEAIARSAESYYQSGYYKSSLPYFIAFLENKPKDKEVPGFISEVFLYFMGSAPDGKYIPEMRKAAVNHLMSEMEQKLHEVLMLKKPQEKNDKRFRTNDKERFDNAFLILTDSGKITERDKINYCLIRFLNSDDDDDIEVFKNANNYLTGLKSQKKLKKAIDEADLPAYVPVQIMHNQSNSKGSFFDKEEKEMYDTALPLLKSSFINIVSAFCNDEDTIKSNPTVVENCYSVLSPAKLVSAELRNKYNENTAKNRKRRR